MASYQRHPLDTERNMGHFSYRIAGIVFWSVLVFFIIGSILFPRLVLWVGRIIAVYTLARLTLTVVFFMVAVARTRCTQKKWDSGERGKISGAENIFHAVLIANFDEPVEIIGETLARLAEQKDARRQIFIVLAMEELEKGAETKARGLVKRFSDGFFGITYSLHPAGLPGEIRGKGSNQAWAARHAKKCLVSERAIPIENIVITSCDVDSRFHRHYFAELTRLFLADEERHVKFWQAPIVYYNNLWHLPVSLRMITYFIDAVQYSDLANPLANAFPISSHSFSLKLADSINFWDTGVISEDYNIYLRSFFGSGGKVSLTPIFLPITADSVNASTLRRTWQAFYAQQLRHAYGAADIGYVLQQYGKHKEIHCGRKLWMLLKLVVDILVVSLAGFAIPIATILAIIYENTPMIVSIPGSTLPVWVFVTINSFWGLTSLGMWIMDRCNAPKNPQKWKFGVLIREVMVLFVFPFLTLGFEAVPVIQALTMLMFGRSIVFKRAPKSIVLESERD